jgi:hypothetical protein
VYLSDSGYGPMASSCEHDVQNYSSIKLYAFLECLHNYCLLKKDSGRCNWLVRISLAETACCFFWYLGRELSTATKLENDLLYI